MKHNAFFIYLIFSLVFIFDVNAEEVSQSERLVKMLVTEDCYMQIDSADRNIASIVEHKGEYYVYTANKIAIYPPDNTTFASKNLVIEEPGQGGLFYKKADPSQVARDTKLTFNQHYIIGYDSGNFSRVKFSVAGKVFYMCRPSYHRVDTTQMPIDTTGFHKINAALNIDTLVLSKTDTLHSITIIEPKHAIFMSCSLNEKDLFESQSFPIKEFNDTERADTYKVEVSPADWEYLKTGDRLHVKMAVLGESGAFDKEYVQSYYVKVIDPSFWSKVKSIFSSPKILTILISSVGLLVIFIVLILLFTRRNKANKRNEQSNNDNVKSENCEESKESKEDANTSNKKEEGKDLKFNSETNPQEHSTKASETSTMSQNTEDDMENALKQKDIIISVYKDEVDRLQKEIEQYKSTFEEHSRRVLELESNVESLNDNIAGYETRINEYKEIVRQHEDTIKNEKNTIINQNNIIASLEREHDQKIVELNNLHETVRGELQNEINKLQLKLEELTSSWADDKKGIINFFIRYVNNIDQSVNTVLNDADPDSQAYMEISQMADSMNGYLSFKNKAIDIFNQPTLTISEVENHLTELLLSDIKYEKSWFNTIARLYAYSQVDELEAIFGYYDSYTEDIKRLYRSLENLAALFRVTELEVPMLFKDEFSSKRYEYKNTNLVMPQLYPNYVEMLKPMVIYDFSRVGYTYIEEVVKPIVAYNTK